jgi:uroporphyrinogen-III decarboxylase
VRAKYRPTNRLLTTCAHSLTQAHFLALCTLQKLNKDVDVDAALGYVYDAIKLTRESISNRVPIYGFCGGPWTVMTY